MKKNLDAFLDEFEIEFIKYLSKSGAQTCCNNKKSDQYLKKVLFKQEYFEYIDNNACYDQKYHIIKNKENLFELKPFLKIKDFDGAKGVVYYQDQHRVMEKKHTLDLHNDCMEIAYMKLLYFFNFAFKENLQDLILITGKGLVLQEQIPLILKQKPFAHIIKNMHYLNGRIELKLKNKNKMKI